VSESILIVDDDAELSGLLVRLLKGEGWTVHSALSASEGDRLLAQHRPALVLLDVMLADDNGIAVCRRWRDLYPTLGILMISARGEPMDKVLGLEMGADDYLAKPFERRELLARVRALLRRQQSVPAASVNRVVFNELEIDLLQREVWAAGQAVSLTGIEYKLLVLLARRPGQTLSRDLLSETVQPGNYRPLDRTVDVQVGRLRRKLRHASPDHEWITTVRGEGYAFTPRVPPSSTPVALDDPPPL
jgi:two-component system phosphate regulon response regulator OmpR